MTNRANVCLSVLFLYYYYLLFLVSRRQMGRQSDRELMMDGDRSESKNKACFADAVGCLQIYCLVGCSLLRECIKLLVNHRRFQQCILLAILINTLSMGIEYHNQVKRLKRFALFSSSPFPPFPRVPRVVARLSAPRRHARPRDVSLDFHVVRNRASCSPRTKRRRAFLIFNDKSRRSTGSTGDFRSVDRARALSARERNDVAQSRRDLKTSTNVYRIRRLLDDFFFFFLFSSPSN